MSRISEIYRRDPENGKGFRLFRLGLIAASGNPERFARHVIEARAKKAVANGKELFRINSHGYRGGEFAAAKPPGTTRVMFYGGSSVFDVDSTGEDDWQHRVERNLKAGGVGDVEVINAGIPGFSSAEAVGTFFAEGHRFSPDYVLLYASVERHQVVAIT